MDSSTKSSNLSKSTLLGDAPILKSILKKSVAAGTTSIGSNEELRSVGQQKGVEDGKLVSDVAVKVKQVDGTILGRDGRVLKPYRDVTSHGMTSNSTQAHGKTQADYEVTKNVEGLDSHATMSPNYDSVVSDTANNERMASKAES